MGTSREHTSSKKIPYAGKSCLWNLPYFDELLLPHNIDVMHTEKNGAEAIFGTIMDISDKTKDNLKARVD